MFFNSTLTLNFSNVFAKYSARCFIALETRKIAFLGLNSLSKIGSKFGAACAETKQT